MKNILISMLFVATASISYADNTNIIVTKIESTIIESRGSYTNVALKLEVTNHGPATSPLILMHALDINGFEITSSSLSGQISHNETKSLTDSRLIKNDIFNRIDKWAVKNIF